MINNFFLCGKTCLICVFMRVFLMYKFFEFLNFFYIILYGIYFNIN